MERRIKDNAEALWSVRMRAIKKGKGQEARGRGQTEVHISGAEGLYKTTEINKAVKDYLLRATNHPRGKPDKVVVTAEKLRQKPVMISLLPVSTVRSDSPEEAQRVIYKLLSGSDISKKALQNGIRVVRRNKAMRGASLMLSESGVRVEPDKDRGIRVSKLGIGKNLEKEISRRLAREKINTVTVKEALILASKVASCRGVIAELCISDDPDYTTGYVASKGFGYVRIPHIKQKGSLSGGRVFFIEDKADVKRVIEYLENTPVIAVTRLRLYRAQT